MTIYNRSWIFMEEFPVSRSFAISLINTFFHQQFEPVWRNHGRVGEGKRSRTNPFLEVPFHNFFTMNSTVAVEQQLINQLENSMRNGILLTENTLKTVQWTVCIWNNTFVHTVKKMTRETNTFWSSIELVYLLFWEKGGPVESILVTAHGEVFTFIALVWRSFLGNVYLLKEFSIGSCGMSCHD